MGVVLLTGLSGSGKTTALRALEDVGYLCMDNLPVVLLPKVIELAADAQTSTRIGVVVDARDKRFIGEAGDVVDELLEKGVDLQIVYLESAPRQIIQRYNETRRRHPLADTGNFAVAIEEERHVLEGLRDRADLALDTSGLTVHELKRVIQEKFSVAEERRMTIKLSSFGFKHGPLVQADLVFDVRFLSNPYFEPRLKDSTGLDPEVAAFVHAADGAQGFTTRVVDLLAFLIPRYQTEGKAYLTIGVGCTGGKHRSVALTEAIGEALRAQGIELTVDHRDREFWLPKSK